MSQNVLHDAQMGMFQVLRPFSGFEATYQGKPGTVPIAFPGTLDPDAGKNGLLPNLLAGTPVPLGSRLLLQIPMVGDSDTEDLVTLVDSYEYLLVWRTKNQSAFRQAVESGRQVAAYHLPSEAIGRNASSFIPGASDVEIFEQSEAVTGASLLNVVQQRYRPKVKPSWVPPLLQSPVSGVTVGAWQQGVYRSASNSADGIGPTWVPLWLDSCGDELLILAYKVNSDEPWDFKDAAKDRGFSTTYGSDANSVPQNNPNIGIILSSGTMGG